MPACLMDSPVGPLLLVEDGGRLAEVRFADGDEPDRDNTPLLKRVQKQIDEFFAGNRRKFDLPLAPARTAFQQRVREAMISIPWGQIGFLVIAAGLAGIIAAIYPSWSASRMNVLEAIAYE